MTKDTESAYQEAKQTWLAANEAQSFNERSARYFFYSGAIHGATDVYEFAGGLDEDREGNAA